MPELPEVQTIVNGLTTTIIGKTIARIESFRVGTVVDNLGDLGKIPTFGTIENISRRGKYIVIYTDADLQILIHLRMSDKLIISPPNPQPKKHVCAQITFTDQASLYFHDPRTFGRIYLYSIQANPRELQSLGPEPLSTDFAARHLFDQSRNRKQPVKNFLLDQRNVAGLGNIYVCEVLYRAGISPHKRAGKLTHPNTKRLVEEIRATLKEAISLQGTSISDFRTIYDQSGGFQNLLRVYGKATCPLGHPVKRIKQAGRSTYYCPICQS